MSPTATIPTARGSVPVLVPALTPAVLTFVPRQRLGMSGERSRSNRLAPERLTLIEGMRAYLAMWVVICHILWLSGYTRESLSGVLSLLVEGRCAVDVFIIVSGFVVFFLLDKQKETYGQFIVRRFFRLFPLFAVLFFAAIPLSRLTLWNVGHISAYWKQDQIAMMGALVESWWRDIQWHIPLHLTMIHGAVPQTVLPNSPEAFLVTAWSVSLEWQFYLVAPLAYALAVSSRPMRRLALCLISVFLFVAARKIFPYVNYGAALPSHLEFFFLGCASYFIYKHNSERPIFESWFAGSCCIAVFLLVLGGKTTLLVPVALWIGFFGLMLEVRSSRLYRLVGPLFTSPVVQFLGRISYSIYLVHLLVVVLFQHVLLRWAPHLSQIGHFWLLLAFSTAATVGLATVAYRFLEAPGMKWGRHLALKLALRDQANAAAMTRAVWAGDGNRPHTVRRWLASSSSSVVRNSATGKKSIDENQSLTSR